MQQVASRRRRPARLRSASLYILACAGLALSGAPSQAAGADPTGLWLTAGGGSIIKIAPCKTNYCGTLAWLKEPAGPDGGPKLDLQNADPSKRGRPMIGVGIFVDLAPEGHHWHGKAYNPQDGKLYDVTFRLAADSFGNKAELKGCVLRILCQTQVLTRAVAIPKPGAVP